jgi:hypothetical protein
VATSKQLAHLVSVFALAAVSSTVAHESIAADPARPYRGNCSTVVTPLTPPGEFPQQLRIDYDCHLAHLGHATAVVMQTVVPTGQSGSIVTASIDNETIYTAANGDTLNASFAGTGLIDIMSGDVRFLGTETFDGGTGRFAAASGSAALQGTASIFSNVGFFTTSGRIAY